MKLRAKASICIAFGLCIFCSGARAEGWDSIGPFGATLSNNDVISGQMNALAIDPRDANILYAGAAEGGVWKTSNGGASWTPLTDTQLVRKLASGKLRGTLSIGSLAVNLHSGHCLCRDWRSECRLLLRRLRPRRVSIA